MVPRPPRPRRPGSRPGCGTNPGSSGAPPLDANTAIRSPSDRYSQRADAFGARPRAGGVEERAREHLRRARRPCLHSGRCYRRPMMRVLGRWVLAGVLAFAGVAHFVTTDDLPAPDPAVDAEPARRSSGSPARSRSGSRSRWWWAGRVPATPRGLGPRGVPRRGVRGERVPGGGERRRVRLGHRRGALGRLVFQPLLIAWALWV